MKRLLTGLLLLLAAATGAAQDDQEGDRIGREVPDSKNTTTADIANYINRYCHTEGMKVRAIYAWVTTHLTYSTDSIQFIATDEDRAQLVLAGMRRRSGLCENFAAIFDELCKKVGLESFYIEGYTRQGNHAERVAHAWDAARVDGNWYLFDPTWDAASGRLASTASATQFRVSPAEFIENHMPFDPMMQFLEHPVTFRDFARGNYSGNGSPYFNYPDSILAFDSADAYERYRAAYGRIERNGSGNELVRIKLQQLRLQLEIIYQDRDSVSYNTAVAEYNGAIHVFNDLAAYRNNQFRPQKSDSELNEMFADIKNHLSRAHALLKQVESSQAALALDTGDIETAIAKLSDQLKEQEAFYGSRAVSR